METEGQLRRGDSSSGFTVLEVLVASVILSVVAAGTMAAFAAAAQMTSAQSNPKTAEATVYARETAETFRDMIACDSPWFNAATCTPGAGLPTAWTLDPLPAGAGTESLLPGGGRRCYRVTQQDCDGVGGVGDCLATEVRVCWNDLTNCPC